MTGKFHSWNLNSIYEIPKQGLHDDNIHGHTGVDGEKSKDPTYR